MMNENWLPMNYNMPKEAKNPLKIYVVADNHKGYGDDYFQNFVDITNKDKPDLALHLGDAVHGQTTKKYDYKDEEKAVKKQAEDWHAMWKQINVDKEIAMGNRDIASNYPLSDQYWIDLLSLNEREEIGGTKLQGSKMIDNGDVKLLLIMLASFSVNQNRDDTLDWVEDQVTKFDGDFIIIADHFKQTYNGVQQILEKNYIKTPAIFLHGHNHPSDTLVRDMWGDEISKLDFPAYCLTNLYADGVFMSLEIHKGGFKSYPVEHGLNGFHEIKKIDSKKDEFEKPIYHYQTRV